MMPGLQEENIPHLDCIVWLQCMGVGICCDEQHLVQVPIEIIQIPHLQKIVHLSSCTDREMHGLLNLSLH